MNKSVKFITQTAVFLALLIVFQFVTKSLGQYVTGSLVNFVLISSALLVSLASGVIIALVSPFLAFLLGIGPAFLPIVPVIAAGNLVIVLVYHLMSKPKLNAGVKWTLAIVLGAALKCAVLYFGVVRLALPAIASLPPQKAAVISASFGLPQLVTALVGGFIALLAVPPVKRSITLFR